MAALERISLANVAEFKKVRLAALRDSPTAFGSTFAKERLLTDEDWRKRAIDWSAERRRGYLAMEAGAACGIVGGFVDEKDPLTVHVISMWVSPEARRSGVGRMLVEGILKWAEERGARTVLLTVTSSNAAAMEFYERLGFSMTGRTEPYPNGSQLVEYEMGRGDSA